MSTDEMHDQPGRGPTEPTPGLAPEDQAAINELIAARAEGGTPAGLSERGERLQRLLGVLDAGPVSRDQTLVDLTLLRVLRASEPDEAQLNSPGADALDAWVHSGFNAGATPVAFRDQASQHERLAALCTAPMAGERDGREQRIDRVLSGIQAQIDSQDERFQIERRRTGLGSLRLADIVSIAAMLLLATAVVLPVLNSVRQEQRVALCRSNFNDVGSAFGMYANSNASMLPMASAGLGGTWLDVGTTPERSNSANLYLLVRTNHVKLDRLACPGNPEAPTARLASDQKDWRSLEEISYSYQVTPRGKRPSLKASEPRIILADRSPVILRLVRGDSVNPEANSTNHNGEGQHALKSDGSTHWLDSPVVGGDNLWLPRVAEDRIWDERTRRGLLGDERPESDRDVFLAP